MVEIAFRQDDVDCLNRLQSARRLQISKALSPGRFNDAVMDARSNPLEVPGAQQIELKMHEWELEIGYSFGS